MRVPLPSGEELLSGARAPRAQGLQVTQKKADPADGPGAAAMGGRAAIEAALGVTGGSILRWEMF